MSNKFLIGHDEPSKGRVNLQQTQWIADFNNYEAQLADYRRTLAQLAKVVNDWRQIYQEGKLEAGQAAFVRPVLASLLNLPPEIRLNLLGFDAEEFMKQLKGK
jgi:hypothetical protein